jgi:hypothetical protein
MRTPSSRSPLTALLLAVLVHALLLSPVCALPAKLGDLDEDGVPTILDVARLAAHFRGTHLLSPEVALFADMNQDGALNEADQEALASDILGLTAPRDPRLPPFAKSPRRAAKARRRRHRTPRDCVWGNNVNGSKAENTIGLIFGVI